MKYVALIHRYQSSWYVTKTSPYYVDTWILEYNEDKKYYRAKYHKLYQETTYKVFLPNETHGHYYYDLNAEFPPPAWKSYEISEDDLILELL